jgi:hypothetical protein
MPSGWLLRQFSMLPALCTRLQGMGNKRYGSHLYSQRGLRSRDFIGLGELGFLHQDIQ